jgi:hypothetical protein
MVLVKHTREFQLGGAYGRTLQWLALLRFVVGAGGVEVNNEECRSRL